MVVPNFWREVHFLSARVFFLETREEEKSHRGLSQENMVDALENSRTGYPVLSKIMSYFRPCDLRRCNVKNKYHRYPSSIDGLVTI